MTVGGWLLLLLLEVDGVCDAVARLLQEMVWYHW
jgi:hypothetical protein